MARPTTTHTSNQAKKTAAKKPAPRTRKTAPKKTTPRLSLVNPTPPLARRTRPFMADTQGFAFLAARMVGITTGRIRDWRDHRDGTATRPLRDGSTLHYNAHTRTLTWQAVCPMGAIHQYELTSPAVACAARVHADRCTTPHTDLSKIKPLTTSELAELGIPHTPTWARPAIPGDEPITETIPVPLPDRRDRTLADTLAHSHTTNDDTRPYTADDITAALETSAEQPKEHPEP
jgi:hypothetical protein